MFLDDVFNRTKDRWPSILMALGVPPNFLKNKHGPCPMCGGNDRWRFDDANGSGRWWCNSCGHGNGLDFVMTYKNITRVDAIKLIEGVIGGSRISVRRTLPDATTSEKKAAMLKLWNHSEALDGKDIASRYLIGRGIAFPFQLYQPTALRWAQGVPFWSDGQNMGYFPCLLARWIGPDNKSANIQRTYLREPGLKADLPDGSRKMMAGPIPAGGAVRLAPVAEEMGVAEGVETALAAMQIFGMPVWSVLGTTGMLRFTPPAECKKLVIFGDRDSKFGGQTAAYSLAHRLELASLKRPIECEVRVPGSGDRTAVFAANKRDWNDVLMAQQLQKTPPTLRVVK